MSSIYDLHYGFRVLGLGFMLSGYKTKVFGFICSYG